MKLLKDILKWIILAVGLVILWTFNFAMICLVLGLMVALLFWLISFNLDGLSFMTVLNLFPIPHTHEGRRAIRRCYKLPILIKQREARVRKAGHGCDFILANRCIVHLERQ